MVNTAYRKTSLHRDKPKQSLRLASSDRTASVRAHRCTAPFAFSNAQRRRGPTSGVSGISLLHDVKKTAARGSGTVYSSTFGRRCRAFEVWWSQTGSNRRPPACKAGALPTELWPLQITGTGVGDRSRAGRGRTSPAQPEIPISDSDIGPLKLVGLERFELSTSRLSSARSNQLSYRPGKRGGRPNEERETKTAVSRRHFAEPV